MKFGCCINMLATPDDRAGINMLESVKESGFDYVEIPLAEIVALSDTEFERLLDRLKGLDLGCESCNNFFPASVRLTGKEVDAGIIRAYLDKALLRAKALGAKILVFGSVGAKNVPSGFPREAAWAQIADALRLISSALKEVIPEAKVTIEPVCGREANILLTYAEGCDMAKMVGRENVECLVDFYHMSVENEPLEHLLKGKLRHVHIANPDGRVYPAYKDAADYVSFFKMLSHIGYDSRISIEAYTKDFKLDATKSIALMKSIICNH